MNGDTIVDRYQSSLARSLPCLLKRRCDTNHSFSFNSSQSSIWSTHIDAVVEWNFSSCLSFISSEAPPESRHLFYLRNRPLHFSDLDSIVKYSHRKAVPGVIIERGATRWSVRQRARVKTTRQFRSTKNPNVTMMVLNWLFVPNPKSAHLEFTRYY